MFTELTRYIGYSYELSFAFAGACSGGILAMFVSYKLFKRQIKFINKL